MKPGFPTLAVLIVFTFCTSFNTYEKRLKGPPGTIRINDTLFADRTEIANVHWREFEYWLLVYANDSVLYEQMLPDSTVWEKSEASTHIKSLQLSEGEVTNKEKATLLQQHTISDSFSQQISFEALTEYYFKHPSYNYYPVVGVSYEQAVAFCKWRGDRVNELYEKHPKKNPYRGKKYRYRLPTIEEWEMIASAENDINKNPYGYSSSLTQRGEKLFNCIYDSSDIPIKFKSLYDHLVSDRLNITAPVESFKENKIGIYNIIGNVSEMTATEAISKGGNFSILLKDCTIKAEQPYTKPEMWLGFRCVCEIIN